MLIKVNPSLTKVSGFLFEAYMRADSRKWAHSVPTIRRWRCPDFKFGRNLATGKWVGWTHPTR